MNETLRTVLLGLAFVAIGYLSIRIAQMVNKKKIVIDLEDHKDDVVEVKEDGGNTKV
jgi:hypothetical protein